MKTMLGLAYCSFHSGNYQKAIEIYDGLMNQQDYDRNLHSYKACCMYALCDYKDAKEEALKAEDSPLRNRLLFHLTEKTGGDDNEIMQYHSALVAGV
jgi:intraflagellar transport protein 56